MSPDGGCGAAGRTASLLTGRYSIGAAEHQSGQHLFALAHPRFYSNGRSGLGTPDLQQRHAAGRTREIVPFRMQSHCIEPADERGAFALPPGIDLRDQNGLRQLTTAVEVSR